MIFTEQIAQLLAFQNVSITTYQGFRQAKAWLFPNKKLIIQAIPLGEALKEWPQDGLLQYSLEQEAKGFRVVHLWEDVWVRQQATVAGRIKSLLGHTERIHGRKTKAKRITLPQLREFLQQHHLQVPTQAKYKYGLWQGEQLVGVASFGSMLTINRGEQELSSSELIRFCTLTGTTVVGGLSKLLQAFIREHQPQHLMTYADRDWSQGASYERLGFEQIGEIPPQQFWIDPKSFERHYPHRISTPIPADWLPAYNTGSLKYVMLV